MQGFTAPGVPGIPRRQYPPDPTITLQPPYYRASLRVTAELGVSHCTLQRLEAGEPIRSDGLLKVISCLGRLDTVLGALESADIS